MDYTVQFFVRSISYNGVIEVISLESSEGGRESNLHATRSKASDQGRWLSCLVTFMANDVKSLAVMLTLKSFQLFPSFMDLRVYSMELNTSGSGKVLDIMFR